MKSSPVSVSSEPVPDGRTSIPILPSGLPVLNANVPARTAPAMSRDNPTPTIEAYTDRLFIIRLLKKNRFVTNLPPHNVWMRENLLPGPVARAAAARWHPCCRFAVSVVRAASPAAFESECVISYLLNRQGLCFSQNWTILDQPGRRVRKRVSNMLLRSLCTVARAGDP